MPEIQLQTVICNEQCIHDQAVETHINILPVQGGVHGLQIDSSEPA